MKSLFIGDKPTVARLAGRLKQAGGHAECQRIQWVPIRAKLGRSAARIAQLLGWSTATVHVLHSRWAKGGDAIFEVEVADAVSTSAQSRSKTCSRHSSSARRPAGC